MSEGTPHVNAQLAEELRRLREIEQYALEFVRHSYMPRDEADMRRYVNLALALHIRPKEWEIYE